VIIATRNGSIPQSGNGHGSQNLVLHETAHALDAAVGGRNDPTFLAARNKDLPTLSSYETQSGTAGPRETYAESFARYYDNPGKAGNANLDKYWATNPLSKP
jgi:Mlc titration factor MtfA (ptsG expression regulator)